MIFSIIYLKMGYTTLRFVILAAHIAFCLSLPHHQLQKVFQDDDDASILGEGIVSAELTLLPGGKKDEATAISNKKTKFSITSKSKGKTDNDPVDFENDEHHGNEQFSESMIDPVTIDIRSKHRPSVKTPPGAVTVASANPIYITIPIYINKAEGQPLRLSVGGQDIPLSPKTSTKEEAVLPPLSPTSQYNRLLKHSDEQTKYHRHSLREVSRKQKRKNTKIKRSKLKRKSQRNHSEQLLNKSKLVSYRFYF